MLDSANEADTTSNTKLIEVAHVGVTAKLQSPLHNFLPSTSYSTESERGTVLLHAPRTSYNKFSNSSHMDTDMDTPKVLYEMRTVRTKNIRDIARKVTPSRIEFQLYRKPMGHTRKKNFSKRKNYQNNKLQKANPTIFRRLVHSFSLMCASKTKLESKKKIGIKKQNINAQHNDFKCHPTFQRESSPFFRIPCQKTSSTQTSPSDTHIGIYHFEHGCSEYLRTTDCHPQILSVILADRANMWATRFWAEIFGSLHIGVAFVVTFFLQTYRFFLFSIVNTILVGFLSMTSDYFIKPLITVTFNGFLQPIFIFIFNILSSIRDLLEPIADNLNNFMKPLATFGYSLRLINVDYGNRKTLKEV